MKQFVRTGKCTGHRFQRSRIPNLTVPQNEASPCGVIDSRRDLTTFGKRSKSHSVRMALKDLIFVEDKVIRLLEVHTSNLS